MTKISLARHRYPPSIIQRAVWLYFCFPLSFRDVEEMLAERGIAVSYETIRRWILKFGSAIAASVRSRRVQPSGTWHIDEVFVRIAGKRTYLWRAVDDEGEVVMSEETTLEWGRGPTYGSGMTKPSPFRYFKTSPEIIRLAVMLYVRFPLSLRNVEDLLHECGIDVSHEAVRFWWHRFGPMFAAEIRKRRIEGLKSSRWRWHLDEIFVKINGERHYLWRAVDHEGEVLESFVTKKRDKKAALKFLKKAMRKHGCPEVIVTDLLPSYSATLKEIGACGRQETGRWLNNRAENSHLPFRRRERAMLRFRRMRSLQKFAAVHASVYKLFNSERSLCTRPNFKLNRAAALAEWRDLGAA